MSRLLLIAVLLALGGCAYSGGSSSSACSGGHEMSQACQQERYKNVP